MMTATAQRDYTQYVNPMIGTNGMGHTFPGACYPFGGVQVSPDTDTIPHNINGRYQPGVYDYCAGYQYRDKTIVGFSHTHFSGTGHSDMGDILLMPFTGEAAPPTTPTAATARASATPPRRPRPATTRCASATTTSSCSSPPPRTAASTNTRTQKARPRSSSSISTIVSTTTTARCYGPPCGWKTPTH